jgi:outer membrane murein-binding lipoprotein Lpp
LTMEYRLYTLCYECMRVEQGKTTVRHPLAAGLRRSLGLAVVVAGLVVAGCASLNADSAPEAKQKVVTERAQARWQALIKGDVDAAYAYLSPASKKVTPLTVYAGTIKPAITWRDVKVDKVDCAAEVCKVQLSLTYDAKLMKGITTPLWESWIIEDGTAWYVYR